ncbi:SA1362 family protein [Bacillus tianshenii]|nr:SA1362 family protein [Bacillus tianshenii]
MFRRSMNPIVMFLISLAVFGLLYKLFTEPMSLLTQLLITAGVVAIFFFIFRMVMNRRYSNSDYAAYRKAAKQSAKLHQSAKPARAPRAARQNRPTSLKSFQKNKFKVKPGKSKFRAPRKKNDPRLTVIEGKKGKKKNRALF